MSYYKVLEKDSKLKGIINKSELNELKHHKNICIKLCVSIMSQQLSTKVAAVIYKRFIELYNNSEPNSQKIVDTPFETLSGIGLSNAKVNYVKNVAQFDLDFSLDYKKLNKMTDEEILNYLIQIKGVGRWTAEMILMFTLGREDVFPIDDLEIQQGMIRLYNIKYKDKKTLYKKMHRIAENWSPYITYACMHIWKWKDIK
jgi:DNA-3-methyladenine glycosylase II